MPDHRSCCDAFVRADEWHSRWRVLGRRQPAAARPALSLRRLNGTAREAERAPVSAPAEPATRPHEG